MTSLDRKAERTPDAYAEQSFLIKDMVKSLQRPAKPEHFAAELIDNALEAPVEGKRLDTSIYYYPDDGRISVKHTNTSGMDEGMLKEYTQWGGIHEEQTFMSEHRMGGKLMLLAVLDEDKSSVAIRSRPSEQFTVNTLRIENWWDNLEPGVRLPIHHDLSTDEETEWTTISIEGIAGNIFPKSEKSLVNLAERLGEIYGPKIETGEMAIILSMVKGRRAKSVNVAPAIVSFEKGVAEEEEVKKEHPQSALVWAGRKGRGPKVQLAWGRVDVDEATDDAGARSGLHDSEKPRGSILSGGKVYYYIRGRLIQQKDLADLNIPHYTTKWAMQKVAVTANVVEGKIPTNILKTQLSPRARETVLLNKKIVNNVGGLIEAIAKDKGGEKEKIPQRASNKVIEANNALRQVLHELFDHDPVKISQEFDLVGMRINSPVSLLTTREEDLVDKKQRTKPSVQTTQLPDKTWQHRGNIFKRQEENTPPTGTKKIESKEEFPLPLFDLESDPNFELPARIAKTDDGTKIILNWSNQRVKMRFRVRNRQERLQQILELGSLTLYEAKVREIVRNKVRLGQTIDEGVYVRLNERVQIAVTRLIDKFRELKIK